MEADFTVAFDCILIFLNLFLQGQCCVSQMHVWHLRNQSPRLILIQILKGTVRCHWMMYCSALQLGLSNLRFYFLSGDLYT